MSRKKDLRQAADDATQSATERGAAAVDQAVSFLAPYVVTAGEYLQTAGEKAGPAAKQARETATKVASSTKDQLEPALHEALDRLSPQIEAAKGRVQDDLVPRLVDLLHEAEKHPAVAEASKRSQAALAAMKGELAVPEKPRKGKRVFKTIAKIVAATALLAGAAVAVKQFLGSKDDGWTAHEPVRRAEPTTSAATVKPSTLLDDSGAAAADDSTDIVAGEDFAASASEDIESDVSIEGDPETDMVDEGGPVGHAESEPVGHADSEEAPTGDAAGPEGADSLGSITYGEGSYVGDEPPEGFVIKGNERSMKFHTPESGGYDRTIADVWFTSTEAAEAAGFTRAQR